MLDSDKHTDEELRQVEKIRVIREEVRVRLEPLCLHLPPAALDEMLDDIALVQYRHERSTGQIFRRKT